MPILPFDQRCAAAHSIQSTQVARFPGRPDLHVSGRPAAAARIHAHAHIIVRHPFFRIADFPVLIFVGRTGGDIRMALGHPLPLVGITVLEGEIFAVGSIGQQNRITACP